MSQKDWSGRKEKDRYPSLRNMATQSRWHTTYARNTVCFHQFTNSRIGGGCWFCPNARKPELKNLRNNHPDLWQRLLDLEDEPNLIGKIWNSLEKKSIHMMEERFRQEDAQMTIWDYLKQKEPTGI